MRTGGRRALGVVAALATMLSLARGASAQSALPASTLVRVTVAGGGAGADALMDTIRELLGRLGLTVDGRLMGTPAPDDASGPTAVRARVEVDFGSPGEVRIQVSSDADHVPVRQTIPRDASESIVREEVAEAVRSAVELQLVSDPNAPPAPAPAPAPTPAPTPTLTLAPELAPELTRAPAPAPVPSPRGVALDLTMETGAGPFAGNSGLVGRFGGGIVVASRRGWRPSLALTGQALVPFDSIAEGVTTHVVIDSFRAVTAIEVLRSYSWFALDVGAGAGFDVLDVSPIATPPAAVYTLASKRTDPVLCAVLEGYFALTPGVVLTIAVAADFDVSARHYLVENGGTDDAILAPWPVRPVAMAGFTFTAFGESLFAQRDAR